MSEVTLLTGGSRSGKSRYALELASRCNHRAFIATAEPLDDEMQMRISRHKEERGLGFITIEEPVDLAGAIRALPADIEIAIVDCLTVWVGNLMYKLGEEEENYPQIDDLLQVLQSPPCDIVLVTNEVGMGIIPDNAMSRRFRDLAGILNQRAASVADRVIVTISGIPLTLKDGEKE